MDEQFRVSEQLELRHQAQRSTVWAKRAHFHRANKRKVVLVCGLSWGLEGVALSSTIKTGPHGPNRGFGVFGFDLF